MVAVPRRYPCYGRAVTVARWRIPRERRREKWRTSMICKAWIRRRVINFYYLGKAECRQSFASEGARRAFRRLR
jgi:hypothetical protein